MLDLTRPVRTRSGLAVQVLCVDAKGVYPVVGLLLPDREVWRWTSHGQCQQSAITPGYDLVNVPVKFELDIWLYVYDSGPAMRIVPFDSLEHARLAETPRARIHIRRQVEEGEGL
jgi:hypothetical protein